MAANYSPHFLRLVSLIWRQGQQAARQLLVQSVKRHSHDKLGDWLRDKCDQINDDVKLKPKDKSSKRFRPLWQSQFDQLFPKSGDPPTEHDLDMTLLVYLLNKFCGDVCSKPEKGALKVLRELRNELAHHSGGVTDDEFDALWKRGVDAIATLDPSAASVIGTLKTAPLDDDMAEELTFLQLQVEEESKMGVLQGKMFQAILNVSRKQNKQLNKISKDLQDVKKTIANQEEMPGNTYDKDTPAQETVRLVNPRYNFRREKLSQNDIEDLLEDSGPTKLVLAYPQMPKESILFKDILSLWNTPDRSKAYILIGVKMFSSNHGKKAEVRGFYENLHTNLPFLNETYVQNLPLFTSFKATYNDKYGKEHDIGVYEVFSSENSHVSPATVIKEISFDDGTVLSEGTILARVGQKCEQLSKGHALYRRILEWLDEKEEVDLTDEEKSELDSLYHKEFCDAMDFFQSGRNHGHYILISGRHRVEDPRLYRYLFKIPWIQVLDFDNQENGLYSTSGRFNKRSVKSYPWKEKIDRLDEDYTNWSHLMGTSHDKLEVQPAKNWYQNVIGALDRIRDEIHQFAKKGSHTVIRMLLLWDDESSDLSAHLEKLLNYLEANFLNRKYVKLSICSPSNITALENLSMEVKEFPLSIRAVLANIWKETSEKDDSVTGYMLPTRDKSKGNNPKIRFQDSLWIGETLDVLYLNSNGDESDIKEVESIGNEFFKGIGIGWNKWNLFSKGKFAIERCSFRDIHNAVLNLLRDDKGTIEIHHSPGGGGTTLAMQILWSLHDQFPCVQVKSNQLEKPNSDLTDQVSDKVTHLHRLTDYPILVYMDEPEKACIEALQKKLPVRAAVLLSTKRSIDVSENCCPLDAHSKKRFHLMGKLNSQESPFLIQNLSLCVPNRTKQLKALSGKERHLIEYSLVAYCSEFQGLQSFVKNVYEALPENQKLVCKYLAFVDKYGNSSYREIELQKFGKILGVPEGEMVRDDKIHNVLETLVKPARHEEDSKLKMMHFLISEEVLKNLLLEIEQEDEDGLSTLAMNFIDFVLDYNRDYVYVSDQKLLASIFTDRDTGTHTESNDETTAFTKVIMHIKNKEHRRIVLEKLRDGLKQDPHTHAHLARFYYLQCNDFEKATGSFQEAVKLVRDLIENHQRERSRTPSDMSTSSSTSSSSSSWSKEHPHQSKARVVYHMFAMMDKTYLSKLGKNLDPKKESKMEQFMLCMKRACDHFKLCREEYTAPEYENYFVTYLSEAFHRIKFCQLMRDKCEFNLDEVPFPTDPNNKYWEKKAIEYLNEYEVIDSLIQKASHCVEPTDYRADAQVKDAYLDFKTLFKNIRSDRLNMKNMIDRRRMIASIKLGNLNRHADKPANSEYHSTLEGVPKDDLKTAIKYLVMNLDEMCGNPETDSRDKWIESDLREWLSAIRQEQFLQDYALTDVLKLVSKCQKAVYSPLVLYYSAIVRFLVGIGSEKKEANPSEFNKALNLFEQLKEEKIRRKLRISKWARLREWLGAKGGIKKMIKSYGGRPLNEQNVCRCTGEIKFPNDGIWYGRIAVCKIGTRDVPATEDGKSLEVHFEFRPKGKEQSQSLAGKRFANKKVRFRLCFTMENGLEASDVELME